MPITNQPIIPNRSLGLGKRLLGFFPPYLAPGLLAGLFAAAIATEVLKGDRVKPALIGGGVVAVYWLYAGKGEEEAWGNFGRLLPIPVLHLPNAPNQDTLIEESPAPKPRKRAVLKVPKHSNRSSEAKYAPRRR
jgi:hypothetical protein